MKKPDVTSVKSVIVKADIVERSDNSGKKAVVVHLSDGTTLVGSSEMNDVDTLREGRVFTGTYETCVGSETEYLIDGEVKMHERDSFRIKSFATRSATPADELSQVDVLGDLSPDAQVALVNKLFA